MQQQQDLFGDAYQARVRQAIEDSAESCGDQWINYAIAFLKWFLERHDTMHVDELWDAGLQEPKSPRGLGLVIQHAARNGWMEKITAGEDMVCCRPSVRSNGQMKAVWRSRLR